MLQSFKSSLIEILLCNQTFGRTESCDFTRIYPKQRVPKHENNTELKKVFTTERWYITSDIKFATIYQNKNPSRLVAVKTRDSGGNIWVQFGKFNIKNFEDEEFETLLELSRETFSWLKRISNREEYNHSMDGIICKAYIVLQWYMICYRFNSFFFPKTIFHLLRPVARFLTIFLKS